MRREGSGILREAARGILWPTQPTLPIAFLRASEAVLGAMWKSN